MDNKETTQRSTTFSRTWTKQATRCATSSPHLRHHDSMRKHREPQRLDEDEDEEDEEVSSCCERL